MEIRAEGRKEGSLGGRKEEKRKESKKEAVGRPPCFPGLPSLLVPDSLQQAVAWTVRCVAE